MDFPPQSEQVTTGVVARVSIVVMHFPPLVIQFVSEAAEVDPEGINLLAKAIRRAWAD